MNPSMLNIEAVRSRQTELHRSAAIERRGVTRTETPAAPRRKIRLVTLRSLRARLGTA